MAATYAIAAYPKDSSLRGGSAVTVRTPDSGDADRVLDFFLKDDVISPALIQEWTRTLNFDRAPALVALDNGADHRRSRAWCGGAGTHAATPVRSG